MTVSDRLSRHRAQKVALADVYADLAEDVVRGCRMEADLEHFEVIQVALRLHRARLATHRNGDVRIVFAIELAGLQPLQEIDSLVDARLHLGPAGVLVRQAWQSNAGDATNAERVIARLA